MAHLTLPLTLFYLTGILVQFHHSSFFFCWVASYALLVRFRFVVADDFHLCGLGDVGCRVSVLCNIHQFEACVWLFARMVFLGYGHHWFFDV